MKKHIPHIIIKIIFITILTFTFWYLLVCANIINKKNGITLNYLEQKLENTYNIESNTMFEYFDKFVNIYADTMAVKIYPLSHQEIFWWVLLYTIIITIMLDFIVGIGRVSPLLKKE